MDQEIIKSNIVNYKGSGSPYTSTAYGNLKLTKEKLILDYYLFGIPGIGKVYGIGQRKIEIPIEKIKEAKNNLGNLVISYFAEDKATQMWLGLWKAFKAKLYTGGTLCNEWVETINSLRKT